MPDPIQIVVLDGDQTGQELLDASLKVLDPEVLGPVSYTHLTLPTNREV